MVVRGHASYRTGSYGGGVRITSHNAAIGGRMSFSTIRIADDTWTMRDGYSCMVDGAGVGGRIL